MIWFWKLLLQLMRWKPASQSNFPHHLKKGVVAIAPHTSNWDFIICLAYRYALNLNNARFLGKAELFKPPFGFFFRWCGGTPVDRNSKHNMVDQVVERINATEHFLLGISPEGTRKKVERLKTGFYHIAKKANIPIVMGTLDFEKKQLYFAEPFFTTDDEEADIKKIIAFYAPAKGKIPENGLAHLIT